MPCEKISAFRRKISLTRRRNRFLTTAQPIFFVQIMPNLEASSGLLSGAALNTTSRPATDGPSFLTRANSNALVMLCFRVRRISRGSAREKNVLNRRYAKSTSDRLTTVLDGVTLVLNFGTLRKKALATFSTTSAEDSSTVFGSHTCTESELTLAAAL